MTNHWRAISLLAAAVVVTSSCGAGEPGATAQSTSTTTTAPAPTAAPPTTVYEGDLDAWCLGWHEGRMFDVPEEDLEETVLNLEAQLRSVVPIGIRDAYRIYSAGVYEYGGSDPDVTEKMWELAVVEVDEFWVDNCDIKVGSVITAAPSG